MPMQSRTDQVHSYEFFLQRVISGMVARESDPAELPFRRLGWSGFGSVMVTVIVAGVVGVVGLLVGGGNTSWQDGQSIIVEKGDETVYIYRGDRLHPMDNMVSAQLALDGAEVARVSSSSLAGVPRGATLGIPGAPQSLPGGDDLLDGPWILCTQQQPTGTGEVDTVSVLGIGLRPDGGEQVGDQGMLVRDTSTEAVHLVWRGYRYEIPWRADAAADALGASLNRALPGSAAWLDALPAGDELEPPRVGDTGLSTTAMDDPDLRTGDVVRDGSRYYRVREDVLVEMTQLEAAIVGRTGVQPVERTVPTDAETRDLSPRTAATPPGTAPDMVDGDLLGRSACAAFAPGEFTPAVIAGASLAPGEQGNPSEGVAPDGSRLADYVVVEGGKAVLVQSLSAPDAEGGPLHVVNDQGVRFGLPEQEVAGSFGYDAEQAVRMSGGLVDLLAAGPALDPAAADQPIGLAAPR